MNIIDFLNARIAEDEAVARNAIGHAVFGRQTGRWDCANIYEHPGVIPMVFAVTTTGARTQVASFETAWEKYERQEHVARHDPARVLAECTAKRAIVAAHPITNNVLEVSTRIKWGFACETCFSFGDTVEDHGYCDTLRALAAIYADHPDYRAEWE